MYQQYRTKKGNNNKGTKILAIIFVLAVLGGGLWYLSKLGKKVEETGNDTIVQKPNSITDSWFVGKSVSLNGEIAAAESNLAYTHTLKVNDEMIKLFSSSRDLSTYKGNVYVRGTVAKFDGKEYIVDVSAVGGSEDEIDTLSLPSSTSTRILPAIGLKIDLTNRSDISYSNSGSIIVLTAESLSGSMRVDGFRCESGFPEKDCETLAKVNSDDSFVSAGGLTYNKQEQNKWFAYNNAGAGYRISSDSDSLLYKISSALIPINENYIKSLVPSAQKLCSSITTATKNTFQKETLSAWKIIIDGKNSAGQVSQCILRVTFTEAGENISLEKQSGSIGTGTTSTTNPTTPGSDVPANTSPTAPVVTASGLVFTSTRGGYTITYPSAKIAYNGVNVQEDLGVKGLSCYIRIDVKDYKDRDDDSIGPGVSIYECTSKLAAETIKSGTAGYTFKTSADGTKLFFIKVQNPAWNEFAANIKIQ